MKMFIGNIREENDYYYKSNFKDKGKKEEELKHEKLFYVLF